MRIGLTEAEIREALAEALAKKIDFKYQPEPAECWFKCEGDPGECDGSVEDVRNVEFWCEV